VQKRMGVVIFCCSRWLTSHWRYWIQCWCGRSWCCIRVTMIMMTTIAVGTSPASPGNPSVGHSLCCPQCAGDGGKPCPAGRNRQLVNGYSINSESWL